MRRRSYLLGVLAVSGLAGCGGDTEDEEPAEDDDEDTPDPDDSDTMGGDEQPAMPAAAFAVDYDGESQELTVTLESGETIRASNLYVRGDGVDDRQWSADSASGSIQGEPAVRAGDSLTLTGVPSDYEVRVVWETGDDSAVLLMDEGPDG